MCHGQDDEKDCGPVERVGPIRSHVGGTTVQNKGFNLKEKDPYLHLFESLFTALCEFLGFLLLAFLALLLESLSQWICIVLVLFGRLDLLQTCKTRTPVELTVVEIPLFQE